MAKVNGFIKLDRQLVRSDVWASLSPGATKLLVEIWSHYNGKNNGSITYGLAQGMRCLRCSKRTAIRRFAELREAELIESNVKGSFAHKTGARKGTATTWRITCLPNTMAAATARSPANGATRPSVEKK